jgi:hypothetical protein
MPVPYDDGSGNSSDLSRVPNRVTVNGQSYDVESEYLPRVVQCENGTAPAESLKAQAIAARTYLTFKTAGQENPTIADGQQAQVFTCQSNHNGSYVPQAVVDAVNATRSQVMLHDNTITAGFFVAGAQRGPNCELSADPTNTQRYVTINVGKTGTDVEPSTIGKSNDPANRGAMSQNLSNCLATRGGGLVASQLLTWFYGNDIQIRGDNNMLIAPTPMENDPAAAPDPGTGTPGQPNTDPNMQTDPNQCWSYTVQQWVNPGACVKSTADQMWYQCAGPASWEAGVDPSTGNGPYGGCTSMLQ